MTEQQQRALAKATKKTQDTTTSEPAIDTQDADQAMDESRDPEPDVEPAPAAHAYAGQHPASPQTSQTSETGAATQTTQTPSQ